MKHLFISLFLILPFSLLAQTKKSDKYFQQGLILFEAEKYEEAVPYFQKSDSLDKAKLDISSPNYYRAELKLADCRSKILESEYVKGNFKSALEYGILVMESRKKILGDHPDYAESLNDVGVLYCLLGNYKEAAEVVNLALEIYKKTLGEENEKYINVLNTLININQYMGNDLEAIRLGTIAIETHKKVYGDDDPDYAILLGTVAKSYAKIEEYEKAIRFAEIAKEIFKAKLGEEHGYYATTLTALAMFHYYVQNYAEAVNIETIAINIKKKILGENHPEYSASLNNLAAYYSKSGNLSKAIEFQKKVLEIDRKNYYDEHLAIANSIIKIANFYFLSENYDEAQKYYKQGYELKKSYILKYFSSMTNNERANFWNINSAFFYKELPFVAYKHSDSTLNILAYNGQVFSKGLLLNTELEIKKVVEQSGDTAFVNLYHKIRENRSILDNLYQIPLEERTISADSLLKVIDNQERLLVESAKEIGDYTKKLSIDFRDIQNKLNDNDLAIEFANFRDTTMKRRIYVAFVLKKGMKAPEFVKLFELDDFWEIRKDEYYTTAKLYNLVWKPLEKYLQGVKNVYFSPSGRFLTIGIEYLPDEKGNIFAKKFDAYRLSSTRELALEKQINPKKKAATFGGMRYNFSEDSENIRRGIANYLAGTKIESDTVAHLLRASDYSVVAFSDTFATEASFKKLSNSGLKILHIGTHGFYYSESDLENSVVSFFASDEKSAEDRALSCSGLLFAGANIAEESEARNAIPENSDDGILTAKEISRLDFRGLDLVVLSACQTGLGEVTGEGVFGLQRGFKKAGAQTIVMSLWEVDDYATRLLMTEFFKNLTLGKSKREAFLMAQDYVREKKSDPKYWAAFIMVDGM